MNKKFTTEKAERSLEKSKGLAALLILSGAILLFITDYSNLDNFKRILQLIGGSFFPIFGIGTLVTNSKKLKKLAGSYVEFKDEKFSFKSRQREERIESISELKHVEIKLDEIDIQKQEGEPNTIYLNDYTYEDRVEIKKYLTEIKDSLA